MTFTDAAVRLAESLVGGTPKNPILRRRYYIQRLFGALVLVLGGALVAANVESLYRFANLRPDVLTVASLVITFAGAVTALFFVLQLFLEFGDLNKEIESETYSIAVGELLEAAPLRANSTTRIVASSATRSAAAPRQPLHVRIAQEMRRRLEAEIRDQGRKASTNLSMGASTALLGIGFLIWLAFDTASLSRDLTSQIAAQTGEDMLGAANAVPHPMVYWGHFAAKVGLSFSANIFSLFFLSTYRRNLTEIKFFQNELTNVEMQLISLFFADEKKYPDAQKKILQTLSGVERNSILKRGETTADIQLKEMDLQETAALRAAIAAFSSSFMPPNVVRPAPRTRATRKAK